MKRIYWVIIWFFTLAAGLTQEFAEPFRIQIRERMPQGTIHQSGETCYISWQVLDSNGTMIPPVFLESKFEHLALTITKAFRSREATVHLKHIAVAPQEYEWQLPPIEHPVKYWFNLEAVPKSGAAERARGRLAIYVRAFQKELASPIEFESCLRLLMDWNGRRGYYTHTSPVLAWQKARTACLWIRDNTDPATYNDYLNVLEKVEKSELAELAIYCPVHQATLKIDHWLVGFFQEWDPQRKSYFLKVPLPTDREQFYAIHAAKGSKRYTTLHTHTAPGECFIPELYDVVYLTLTSDPIVTQAAVEGRAMPTAHTKHVLELYAGKAQSVHIQIQGGPHLKIIINPKGSVALELRKNQTFFTLYHDNESYEFVANEVNLLEFK